MRRLLAINLIFALLGQLSAAMAVVARCPMHEVGPASGHDHAGSTLAGHHQQADQRSPSHHGTSTQGCKCTGVCGRFGAEFILPAKESRALAFVAGADVLDVREQPELASADRLLPFATGPPQRLRI